MLREQAYKIVQGEAMRAWHEEGDFKAAIESHPEVRKYLTPEKLQNAFSVHRLVQTVLRHQQGTAEKSEQNNAFRPRGLAYLLLSMALDTDGTAPSAGLWQSWRDLQAHIRAIQDATAPDLTGYGSRRWLISFINNSAHEDFYGKHNDRMQAFRASQILTIAAGVPSGAGAALAAAEQDRQHFISGVVATEPQVQVSSTANIQRNGAPVASKAKQLYDYITLAALYQGCAAGAAGISSNMRDPVLTAAQIKAVQQHIDGNHNRYQAEPNRFHRFLSIRCHSNCFASAVSA